LVWTWSGRDSLHVVATEEVVVGFAILAEETADVVSMVRFSATMEPIRYLRLDQSPTRPLAR
jgi:hypothetical protein